jgi:hypothetical protein
MPQSYLDSQSTYVDKDSMIGLRAVTTTTADTATYTNEDSGRIVIATKASATQVFTLPAVASGLEFTFVCGHASGEILVNPTGTVVFNIKASEGGAAVATVAGTGIKNTAATNILGDSITLICDGTSWYGTKQSGTWASQ